MSGRGRNAHVALTPLRHCLVNLPLSIHGPLVERGVAPQSIVVELSFTPTTSTSSSSSKKAGPHKTYCGWTGMPSQLSSVITHVRGGQQVGDRVEMDPQFASMIGEGLGEGTSVTIELLRDLPTATSVSVTPLTPDDWEILESNAEFVETHLLNQVRAVREGTVVGCWVGGTTLVRFMVDSTSPAASPALLLTADTELIVAPKTRHALPPPAPAKAHDLTSTSTAPTPAQNQEWESISRKLVRLLPKDVEGLGIKEDEDGTFPVAYVSPGAFAAFKSALPALTCLLGHHPRPVQKGEGGEREKEKEKDAKAVKEELKKVEVKVREGRSVPTGHVWIGQKARKELGVEGSYELLKFSAPLSAAAKKAKLKEQEKDRPEHLSPKMNGSSSSRPSLTHKVSRSSPAETTRELPVELTYPILAGIDDKLDAIRSHVVNSLAARSLGSARLAASGILVTGASGAGKTALVKQATRELSASSKSLTHTIYIDCSKHTDERLPTLKSKMKDWFDEACWHAPTVMVLDNLDRMLGAEVEHADSFPALHLAHTFLGCALPALATRPIILLATAQSSASLHPLLSTTHLLGESVSLRGPSKTGRRDILSSLVKAKSDSSDLVAPSLNYATIAGQTEGYLPADLRDLVDRAIHQAAMRGSSGGAGLELTLDDFTTAQAGFVPLSLRDVKLQKSEVQWADIGGLHETRRVLRETLEWPTKYGAIFASCPLRLRSGLLLYGYPGCGKTLLASAVAKECGLNFISVKGPEILNKYIGASEKSVRDLFDRAQAAKPCILFFDEFDSIAPKRGHDSTGVTDRVVNQMLTQMDGAEGLDGVYVLAATSRPDLIDPALLRPGRLDKSLLCDMPSHEDRLEIMQACARKVSLSPSVDLSEFAARAEGFSGADLQALIYNAHLDAIHAGLSATTEAVAEPEAGRNEVAEFSYTSFGGSTDSEKVLSRAEQATVTKRLELIMNSLASARASKAKAAASTPSSRPTLFRVRFWSKLEWTAFGRAER
ncbi:peroxin-1 [Pseudohyphozyma bogoriensis]|nr:peroxin-1 [Pseudohyphozyma bogoriensis]